MGSFIIIAVLLFSFAIGIMVGAVLEHDSDDWRTK